MRRNLTVSLPVLLVLLLISADRTSAADLPGAQDHPMVSRYPGQSLRWQVIENHREFRIPTGAVTGYRQIADWIDVEGRVTRSFYRYDGADRSWNEIYLNYRDALVADYGIARERLLGQGVGPLNPVYRNSSDAGRDANRRVELVERLKSTRRNQQ